MKLETPVDTPSPHQHNQTTKPTDSQNRLFATTVISQGILSSTVGSFAGFSVAAAVSTPLAIGTGFMIAGGCMLLFFAADLLLMDRCFDQRSIEIVKPETPYLSTSHDTTPLNQEPPPYPEDNPPYPEDNPPYPEDNPPYPEDNPPDYITACTMPPPASHQSQ
ncbi:hypothetical protein [uncultured Endozoicomonas sp.]|uniref:hypothetical protein n=1 Tax=uncultured Endozoicomonas sp. TaxID=432652 RepID=UPI00260F3D58|nr:hypothetical protein [uncultured Endozoicomonas sp.]